MLVQTASPAVATPGADRALLHSPSPDAAAADTADTEDDAGAVAPAPSSINGGDEGAPLLGGAHRDDDGDDEDEPCFWGVASCCVLM